MHIRRDKARICIRGYELSHYDDSRFMMSRLTIAVFAFGLIASPAVAADKKKTTKKPTKITYDDHVKPIFRAKCFACHNTSKKSGGLDLTTYTNLMQGGSSGEVIVAGSADDSYLYDLVTHQSEPKMPPKSEKIAAVSLSTIKKWIDGGALENAGSKAVIKKKFDLTLKSAPTGKPTGPPPMPQLLSKNPVVRTTRKTAVTALATSPWAPLAAVAGQKQVFIYNTKSLQLVGVLPFPEGIANVLKFSRNSSLLLAAGGKGSASGKAVVWNVKTGKRVIEVGDELDEVLAADISSDHRFIALGGPQRLVRIYSTQTGKLLHEIKKHTEWIYSIEFSPDGVLLATADRNGGMFVWETFTAREFHNLKGHGAAITDVSWRLDSNILSSCSEDGTIRLWEMQNGRAVKRWTGHGGGAASIEFTRDGRLVSCGRDRLTRLWDQNGKAVRTFARFSDIGVAVTYCDEAKRVIAGDWTGAIRVWNATDGKQLGELSTNPLPLKDRLSALQGSLKSLETKKNAAAAAYQNAVKVVAKYQTDLANANKAIADAKKLMQTATAAQKSARATLAAAAKELPALQKAVTDLQAVVTPLTEAVAKAEAAGKKAAGDKALQSVIASLKSQLNAKNTALANAKKALSTKQSVQKTATTQLAKAKADALTAPKKLAAAQATVKATKPKLKATQTAAAKAKPVADQAAAAFNAAKQSVEQLKRALEVETALSQLSQHRSESDKLQTVSAEKQAAFVQAKKAAGAANAIAVAAKTQADQIAVQMKTTDALVAAANKAKSSASESVKQVESFLPSMKELLGKVQLAAKKAPQDKDIANTVKSLTERLKQMTAKAAAHKKTASDKIAEIAKLNKQSADLKTKLVAANAKLKSAIANQTAALKAMQSAQAAAANAKSAADAAQKRVDQLRSDLVAKATPKKVGAK